MKEIYFHIGLVKTGSTWLQEVFFPKLNLTLIRTRQDFVEMANAQSGKFLVSYEGLSGNYHKPVEFRYYYAYGIKALHPNAKIILGLRKQDSWLKSMYTQNIKTGHAKDSYKDWYNSLDLRICNFDEYLLLLKNLFGNNVYIYHFEDFKQNKQKILKEICCFLDVECPVLNETRKVNVGLYGYEKYLRYYTKIVDIIRTSLITFFKVTKSIRKRIREGL
jgi:hypothetical protein